MAWSVGQWLVAVVFAFLVVTGGSSTEQSPGGDLVRLGQRALVAEEWQVAADLFLKALTAKYEPLHVPYHGYLTAYAKQQQTSKGYLRLAKLFKIQGSEENFAKFLDLAVQSVDSSSGSIAESCEALSISAAMATGQQQAILTLSKAAALCPEDARVFFNLGTELFSLQAWEESTVMFKKAYSLDPNLHVAFINSFYLETRVCLWEEYEIKLEHLRQITSAFYLDKSKWMTGEIPPYVEPHMSLSFHLPGDLKLAIATFAAEKELAAVLSSRQQPYQYEANGLEAYDAARRIRVGYISSDFRLKATAYLIRYMMGFHDRERFEVFCIATSHNSERKLRESLGADWRADIKRGCEHFIDVTDMPSVNVASLVHDQLKLALLVNMDGYSNNGIRKEGVFPLQPAPIQISFLVYVGTMGASYIQYVVTDPVTSPVELETDYSEKFLYMPQSFFINSHAYMSELTRPKKTSSVEGSFNFCNFNKHLKFTPVMFDLWCKILRTIITHSPAVRPALVLLENPAQSRKNILTYMQFKHVDLLNRGYDVLKFLPFEANPYSHQARIARNCHVVLDNPVYNAHTMAVDTLFSAVPIVTLGNGTDMGGRVVTSMLSSLALDDLIAQDEGEYHDIAVYLATDSFRYVSTRQRLLDSIERLDPFWNTSRYVENLEHLYTLAFLRFLSGESPSHLSVTLSP